MPNEIGDYAESDTTADEFDAMWDSAEPVDTLSPVAINAPVQRVWIDSSEGVTLFTTSQTNQIDTTYPLSPPTSVPDTTASVDRAVGTNVPLSA